MSDHGKPVHGELHSSNASSGVEIQLYEAGSNDEYELQEDEFLTVSSVLVSNDDGAGDIHVHFGESPSAGSTIVRANMAANTSISHTPLSRCGARGEKPHVTAPAGDIDVLLTGYVTRA